MFWGQGSRLSYEFGSMWSLESSVRQQWKAGDWTSGPSRKDLTSTSPRDHVWSLQSGAEDLGKGLRVGRDV